jgi:hypothetical protein
MLDDAYRCRVCGLVQSDPPWGEDGKTPSFDSCECCGVEFGYGDATPVAVIRSRDAWLTSGAPWYVRKARPAQWDLNDQMRGLQ